MTCKNKQSNNQKIKCLGSDSRQCFSAASVVLPLQQGLLEWIGSVDFSPTLAGANTVIAVWENKQENNDGGSVRNTLENSTSVMYTF